MRISVFGLGYVGAVSAAVLARAGHDVVGVDSSASKVQMLNAGVTPVVEPGLDTIVAAAVQNGRLRATSDATDAVIASELSLVCVGTPSQKSGKVSITAVGEVSRQIGQALRQKKRGHVVVLRSTVPSGTTRNFVAPLLETHSGGHVGRDFGLAHNPEFLREGTAIDDFAAPPKTVIGALDDLAAEATASLYDGIDAPLIRTTPELSELAKYVDNVWHALKVCFGNEVGNLCKELGVDSHELMDMFCRDTKLNISPYYLRPGFAFGGSCLPKDTAALMHLAREYDLDLPVINSLLTSNRTQINRAVERIVARGKRRITLVGLSFKNGTNDLRQSPLVALAEQLIGKGHNLRIYDPDVYGSVLTGANSAFVAQAIPHLHELMVDDLGEAVAHGELLVIGKKVRGLDAALDSLNSEQEVVDLVRVKRAETLGRRYDGINW